jgi:hypothetical protein
MAYSSDVAAKGRTPPARLRDVKPAIRPRLKPVIAPVLDRLDRNERLLMELKHGLDIQFQRTAAIQAQLDLLLARLSKQRS